MPGAALIAAIPSMIKAGLGAYQSYMGKKLAGTRPEMDVPPGVQQALRKYQKMADQTRVAGQDVIEGNIRGATAAGAEKIMDISSGGEGLGAISQIVSQEQQSLSDLGVKGAQMKRGAEEKLAVREVARRAGGMPSEVRRGGEQTGDEGKADIEEAELPGTAHAWRGVGSACRCAG